MSEGVQSPPAGGGFGWTNPDLPQAPEPSNRPKHSPLLVVIGLGVLIVAGWLVVTVLGGGSGGKLNPIAQAAERTAAVPGARFTVVGSAVVPQSPTPIAMSGRGAIDFENETGRMTLSGPATSPIGAIRIDFILTSDAMYMASPQFAAILPPGKTWIGTPSSGDQSGTASTEGNPHTMLEQLKGLDGPIATVGSERIDGVSTIRYRANTTEAGAEIPVDVWIDHRGLVRRIQESGTPGNTGGSVAIRLDFHDFGFTPRVATPPSGEVADAQDIAQSIGAQLGQ